MKIGRRNARRLLTTIAASMLPIFMMLPAHAGTCEGTVIGLSGTYNAKTGSGFLAVRSGKSANSRKVGELFNGDVVTIWAHEGKWYQVDDGWVFDRYISARNCDD